jgi:hypothetical protein
MQIGDLLVRVFEVPVCARNTLTEVSALSIVAD